MEFVKYQKVPARIQEEIVKKAQLEKATGQGLTPRVDRRGITPKPGPSSSERAGLSAFEASDRRQSTRFAASWPLALGSGQRGALTIGERDVNLLPNMTLGLFMGRAAGQDAAAWNVVGMSHKNRGAGTTDD